MDAFRKQFDLAIKFIEVCLFEKVSRETINILECNTVPFSIFLKFHTLEHFTIELISTVYPTSGWSWSWNIYSEVQI